MLSAIDDKLGRSGRKQPAGKRSTTGYQRRSDGAQPKQRCRQQTSMWSCAVGGQEAGTHRGAAQEAEALSLHGLHVVGSTMDWQEDEFTAGFVFNNPNATGSCGCGESFTV